jgi:hypothetical protein
MYISFVFFVVLSKISLTKACLDGRLDENFVLKLTPKEWSLNKRSMEHKQRH